MSIKIMSAAWDLDLGSTDKLVLLALADWSNDEGHCWPSIARLCTKCGLSERAIQVAIKRLVVGGHLTRTPVAGKGVNYLVHPATQQKMEGYTPPESHYVYRITDVATGEFYIGARTCVGPVAEDGYMGSGKWVQEARRLGADLAKEIIEELPSREALAHAELRHALQAVGSDLCRNAKLPTPGSLSKTKQPPQDMRPAGYAPRINDAPHQTTPTPAPRAPNTSVHTNTSEAKASSVRRATRLPDDFVMPVEWKRWAQSKRSWSFADADDESEAFIDYWQAKPGANARKLNWEKTWHNWVRNSRRPSSSQRRNQSLEMPA